MDCPVFCGGRGVTCPMTCLSLSALAIEVFFFFSLKAWCVCSECLPRLSRHNHSSASVYGFIMLTQSHRGAGNIAQCVNACLANVRAWAWIPGFTLKCWMWWCTLGISALGRQRQVDPWGSLASKPSWIGSFCNHPETMYQKKRQTVPRNNSQSWPLAFTLMCTYTYIDAYQRKLTYDVYVLL